MFCEIAKAHQVKLTAQFVNVVMLYSRLYVYPAYN